MKNENTKLRIIFRKCFDEKELRYAEQSYKA